MAKRKMPPRYKSGPKKGQFKPRANRRGSTASTRSPSRGRTSRAASKTRGRSATLSQRKARKPAARRYARKNPPTADLVSVAAASGAVVAWGQFVTPWILEKYGSNAAEWTGIGVVGLSGAYLTMAKGGRWAKARPAGYALLGVAFTALFGKVAGYVKQATEAAGSPFVPSASVYQPLPRKMNVPNYNPVARVVVP